MVKNITLLSFLLVFSTNVLSKDYHLMTTFTKDWKRSNKKEFLQGKLHTKTLEDLDSIYSYHPNAYFFLYNEQALQVYVACGFNIYEIQSDTLKLQYNYHNRGYNCYSRPFVRESENYLLGGHGFWTHHMDLLKFDKVHGSWEIVRTINQPIDYLSAGIFQNTRGIYTLFGGRNNIRTELDEIEYNGYFLDWETKKWNKIEVIIDGVDNKELFEEISPKFIETRDYVFLVITKNLKNVGWNIIEKETGKIYFYDHLKNEDVFFSPYIEIINNQINYESPNGTAKTLDVENLFAQSKLVGEIIITRNQSTIWDTISFKERLYLLIILLLILLVLNLYIRRKPENSSALLNGFEEIESMAKSFTAFIGQTLNTEELDNILGIQSLDNIDSKRLKRSRWINKLNEYQQLKNGNELIVRDKKPDDKRFVYYRINGQVDAGKDIA
jgi:hypothetical protein